MKPRQLEELASEYVLGTLSAEQRAEVEQRLPHDADLRAAVDAWEQRLLALTDLADRRRLGKLWQRIERSVNALTGEHHRTATAQLHGGTCWRYGAAWPGQAGGDAGAGTLLLTRTAGETAAYLVVLVAPQNQAPGWVIQASNPREIQLIPLGVDGSPSRQGTGVLDQGRWLARPGVPGLVKPGQTLSVPLDRLPPLEPDQLFELTLEDPNGSPTGKPTGPIQFIGRAVKVI